MRDIPIGDHLTYGWVDSIPPDAGLKDTIVESGPLGEDSVMQMLKGKQFNNAISYTYVRSRGNKLNKNRCI